MMTENDRNQLIHDLNNTAKALHLAMDSLPPSEAANMLAEMELAVLFARKATPVPVIWHELPAYYGLSDHAYTCGACGKPIDEGDEYCRHCGRGAKWP